MSLKGQVIKKRDDSRKRGEFKSLTNNQQAKNTQYLTPKRENNN